MAKLGAAALGHLPKSTWVWARATSAAGWIRFGWAKKPSNENLREKKNTKKTCCCVFDHFCWNNLLPVSWASTSDLNGWHLKSECLGSIRNHMWEGRAAEKTEAFVLNEILQPFHPSPMCSLFTFRSPEQLADGDFSQIAHPLKEKKMTLPLKWFWRFHYVFPKTISHHPTPMLSCSIWGQFLLWTTSATEVLGWMNEKQLWWTNRLQIISDPWAQQNPSTINFTKHLNISTND